MIYKIEYESVIRRITLASDGEKIRIGEIDKKVWLLRHEGAIII